MAAVVLRELTRRFGENIAARALSFEVEEGELFGIVGPDGAGKTTTLRMLAGVLRPTSGDAEIFGTSVAARPEDVKPMIAYMSQRFGLYQDLTVRENLDFYADLFQVPRADRPDRFERLYRFSNLGGFENRLAGDLSGGMRQKLALSCSLIHRPRLLLLDEPTFGVDPISRRDLWLILHEMVAEGVTVVVSTSYLDEAERCDRVVLLHEGSVLALDTPDVLRRSLSGTLVAIRASDARVVRERVRSLPGVRRASIFGNTVHVLMAEDADEDRLRGPLQDAGITIHELVAVEPSLEDLFIDLAARHA